MNCPPLLALTHRENADHHWRCARPFARLAEAGVDTRIHRLVGDEIPLGAVDGRVVVLPRVVVQDDDPTASVAYVNRLRAAGALAVVFEIDDDELSDAAGERDRAMGVFTTAELAQFARERQWIANMVRAVDAVTVSTEPLAAVVRRYTDKPVHTLPNAIDVEWFRERLSTRVPWSDHLTIGWAGYRRPEADLEPMAVAWGRIASRYPGVRFVVAGWQADCIYEHVDPERIFRVPWTTNLDDYPKGMQVDIGCCPLADTVFNRCKSPIKAWEYALAGAAVVTSRTVYGEPLQGIAARFTADTVDEWENAIRGYIQYPDLRVAYQDDCRSLLERVFSLLPTQDQPFWVVRRGVERWAAIYSEIAASVGVRV